MLSVCFPWQWKWERWEKSVRTCLLNCTDFVCEGSHILGPSVWVKNVGLHCISVWSSPLCLICLFEVSPDSQSSPFSPVPIIIMIIMIIIIISAQLDAWPPDLESSLCVRSEQFASSLRKPVAQKKLRYRVCQRYFSLVTYCLSCPMNWAACEQFGEITLQHLKFCSSSQSQSRGKEMFLMYSLIHFHIFCLHLLFL